MSENPSSKSSKVQTNNADIISDNVAGGALVIGNNKTQTSGDLVKVTGTAGQSALNVTEGNVVVSHGISTGSRALFGDYTGLTYSAPTVDTNATTLVKNNINAPVYTGGEELTATLPAANAGDVCVFLFAEDPKGGTAALTIDCAGTDAFVTGSAIPTTVSNKIKYDISTLGETSIKFTPTNDTVNFISFGSTIEFVCLTKGLWNVHVRAQADIGVTDGAATGTLVFAD